MDTNRLKPLLLAVPCCLFGWLLGCSLEESSGYQGKQERSSEERVAFACKAEKAHDDASDVFWDLSYQDGLLTGECREGCTSELRPYKQRRAASFRIELMPAGNDEEACERPRDKDYPELPEAPDDVPRVTPPELGNARALQVPLQEGSQIDDEIVDGGILWSANTVLFVAESRGREENHINIMYKSIWTPDAGGATEDYDIAHHWLHLHSCDQASNGALYQLIFLNAEGRCGYRDSVLDAKN